jgi:hypothetical protein
MTAVTGESGTFIGHFIPAMCFLGLGLFFLLLSLSRARRLSPGESFTQNHVPEQDRKLLKTMAWVAVCLTCIGLLVEGGGTCTDPSVLQRTGYSFCFFENAGHQMLYLSYGGIAPFLFLEAAHKLPLDTSRIYLALALLLNHILWREHAIMKSDMLDQRVHVLMAQLCLVHASIMLASVCKPTNLILYIAGWGLFVLQATWLLTLGVNAGMTKLDMHKAAPLFCFQVVAVTLTILVLGAGFGAPASNTSNTNTYEKVHLTTNDDKDDDDDDHDDERDYV